MVDMSGETHVVRKIDPFLAALSTAVVSCSLLAIAVMYGWLGPDVGEGSNFCEALRTELINQPANTWSNIGFVIAGLMIGWQGRKNPQLMEGLVGFFACVVVLLGPASAAMHATGTVIGQNLDLTSMFLISSFAVSYALKRWYGFGRGIFLAIFLVWLALGEFVLFLGIEIPVLLHGGNLIFAIGLILALTLEVGLWRRTRSAAVARAGIQALSALIAAFAIWLLDQGPLCDPDSLIQGHALWHILCAVASYCQFLVYRAHSEVDRDLQSRAPDPARY